LTQTVETKRCKSRVKQFRVAIGPAKCIFDILALPHELELQIPDRISNLDVERLRGLSINTSSKIDVADGIDFGVEVCSDGLALIVFEKNAIMSEGFISTLTVDLKAAGCFTSTNKVGGGVRRGFNEDPGGRWKGQAEDLQSQVAGRLLKQSERDVLDVPITFWFNC
jgi:hypothetical protein